MGMGSFVFVFGYMALKPSLARMKISSGEFVVEEQFDVWCFLEFIKKSIIQSCPID